jgi:predicted NBD/HSP70 family sugar kinase
MTKDTAPGGPARRYRAARITYVQPGAGANGAVTEDLRRYNRGLILELVSRHESVSRVELAAHTQLTGAAVSRITRELLDMGLLVEHGASIHAAVRGRPTTTLKLASDGGFVVGVGVGAYEQWLQIGDLRGRCLRRQHLEMPVETKSARYLSGLAREIKALIRDARVPRGRMLGVGISVAGVVDHERGVVIDSPNLGWHDVNLKRDLQKALACNVQVEGLHHALNLAEAHDDAVHGVTDSILVQVAMGIGASVMEYGRIVRGSHAAAGQIGHMRVEGASELCTCGRRGCLDTVASGYAVLRRLGLMSARRVAREHHAAEAQRLFAVIEQEQRGDEHVSAAFRACGERLGSALNAVRSVLDPGRIVLAGPLSRTGSFMDGVRARIEQLAVGERTPGAPLLQVANHSSDSAAVRLALSAFVFSAALDLRRLR